MTSAQRIWVFVEHVHGRFENESLEVLRQGHVLARALSKEVVAIVVAESPAPAASELFKHGANRTLRLACADLSERRAEALAAALQELVETETPKMVLLAASRGGNDIAYRLASLLGGAAVTDCTEITTNAFGVVHYTKAIFGGKLAGTYVSRGVTPQVATLLPSACATSQPDTPKGGVELTFRAKAIAGRSDVRRVETIAIDPQEAGLEEAEVIVSGGRGLGSPDRFRVVQKLSQALGGTVGASLAAVETGYARRDRLVGQTGATVSPKLYVALGISGSVYHLAGIQAPKAIIAINTDRHAQIFKYSDLGLVGDAHAVAEAIARRLCSNPKDVGNER